MFETTNQSSPFLCRAVVTAVVHPSCQNRQSLLPGSTIQLSSQCPFLEEVRVEEVMSSPLLPVEWLREAAARSRCSQAPATCHFPRQRVNEWLISSPGFGAEVYLPCNESWVKYLTATGDVFFMISLVYKVFSFNLGFARLFEDEKGMGYTGAHEPKMRWGPVSCLKASFTRHLSVSGCYLTTESLSQSWKTLTSKHTCKPCYLLILAWKITRSSIHGRCHSFQLLWISAPQYEHGWITHNNAVNLSLFRIRNVQSPTSWLRVDILEEKSTLHE